MIFMAMRAVFEKQFIILVCLALALVCKLVSILTQQSQPSTKRMKNVSRFFLWNFESHFKRTFEIHHKTADAAFLPVEFLPVSTVQVIPNHNISNRSFTASSSIPWGGEEIQKNPLSCVVALIVMRSWCSGGTWVQTTHKTHCCVKRPFYCWCGFLCTPYYLYLCLYIKAHDVMWFFFLVCLSMCWSAFEQLRL